MVYSPLQAAAKYFKYYVHAASGKGHGTHSPFVYEFITKVMNDFTKHYDYEKVEGLRKQLLENKTEITIQDFGAGSAKTHSNHRSIASIAKNAAKPKKFGQLLYRMIKFYRFQNILELGTSLGITTSYLALANPLGKVTTMEGCSTLAEIARKNFIQLGIDNIDIVRGNFDSSLQDVLIRNKPIDFAFIDGNHRQEATERYFQQLLPFIHNNSLLIFDDIHWSPGMEAAWKKITTHTAVTAYIDLFYIGIISFRNEFKEKQEFTVRF